MWPLPLLAANCLLLRTNVAPSSDNHNFDGDHQCHEDDQCHDHFISQNQLCPVIGGNFGALRMLSKEIIKKHNHQDNMNDDDDDNLLPILLVEALAAGDAVLLLRRPAPWLLLGKVGLIVMIMLIMVMCMYDTF